MIVIGILVDPQWNTEDINNNRTQIVTVLYKNVTTLLVTVSQHHFCVHSLFHGDNKIPLDDIGILVDP